MAIVVAYFRSLTKIYANSELNSVVIEYTVTDIKVF